MAKADFVPADRTADFPVTANDKVAETVVETPDQENRDEALANGVQDAAFIDYDVALNAYGAREDIEDLDSKVRRNTGLTGAAVANQEHMRELPNRSGGNGVAPDPDNAIVVEGYDAGSDPTP